MSLLSRLVTCEGCGCGITMRGYGAHWRRAHRDHGMRPTFPITLPFDSRVYTPLPLPSPTDDIEMESLETQHIFGLYDENDVSVPDYMGSQDTNTEMAVDESNLVKDQVFEDAGLSDIL